MIGVGEEELNERDDLAGEKEEEEPFEEEDDLGDLDELDESPEGR